MCYLSTEKYDVCAHTVGNCIFIVLIASLMVIKTDCSIMWAYKNGKRKTRNATNYFPRGAAPQTKKCQLIERCKRHAGGLHNSNS